MRQRMKVRKKGKRHKKKTNRSILDLLCVFVCVCVSECKCVSDSRANTKHPDTDLDHTD